MGSFSGGVSLQASWVWGLEGVSFGGSSACVGALSPSFSSDSSSGSGSAWLGGAWAPPTAPPSSSLLLCSGVGVALLVFLTVVAISSACTGRGLVFLPSLSDLQFRAICPALPHLWQLLLRMDCPCPQTCVILPSSHIDEGMAHLIFVIVTSTVVVKAPGIDPCLYLFILPMLAKS